LKIGVAAVLLAGALLLGLSERRRGGGGARPEGDKVEGAPPIARAGAPSPADAALRLAPPPSPILHAIPAPDAPLGAIAGQVRDRATGRGIPGAQVMFSYPPSEATASVVADGEGRFRYQPERAGKQRLQVATATGYLPFAPELGESPIQVVARPGIAVEGLVVWLAPAVEYLGVVLGADGGPIAGAEVRLLGAGADERALYPLAERFLSDARGELRFHAPDWAVLVARKPGFASARAAVDIAAQISHRLELRLKPGAAPGPADANLRLAGRVVDREGKPIAGAKVVAAGNDAEGLGGATAATSGDDGRFALAGLLPGPHVVTAGREGYAAARRNVTVTAGMDDLVLTLAPGGSIAGRVVDAATGAPVPAFTVVVLGRDGPLRELEIATQAVIDAEGRFQLSDLPDEPLRVRAAAGGWAQSPALDTRVGATDLEIRIGRGGTLVGTVVDASARAPIAGARVSMEGLRGERIEALPGAPEAVTDADGSFTLLGIPLGTHSLTVLADGHHGRIVSGLQVAEGAALGPITVELSPLKPGEQPGVEMVGIGAVLGAEGDALVVRDTMPGGGAAEAGMLAGDAILAIDGVNVLQMGFQEGINRIRGPEGSEVRLTVRRGQAVSEMTVVRRKIRA
jgi:carboxypeptidase family protein/PDZ domain-containing protein